MTEKNQEKGKKQTAQVTPTDGMVIKESCTLAPGQYFMPQGITVAGNNITVDGTGVHFIGTNCTGRGIQLENCSGCVLKGFTLSHYYHAISITDADEITVSDITVSATHEMPSETEFLDIWLPADKAYGGALILCNVSNAAIHDNVFEHNMNGIMTYKCSSLKVLRNKVNYCSGFGVHLKGTCDSLFEDNSADFCCRYNVRNDRIGIERTGHMGADATGFLILAESHRNTFHRNFCRMGSDGFFLAGCNKKGEVPGANDNIFEENDASLSPNISFEATFSRGNIFRNNVANNSNFGFWLGFSTENILERNRIAGNRMAGIATENGWNMTVRDNTFHGNGHGILLWSQRFKAEIMKQLPGCETSHDWNITENIFNQNSKAIRIAALQDHGIRDLEGDITIDETERPYNHAIVKNNIQDNRIGVELVNCNNTQIEYNVLHHNPEANIVQTDCRDTVITTNLGAYGAYLK